MLEQLVGSVDRHLRALRVREELLGVEARRVDDIVAICREHGRPRGAILARQGAKVAAAMSSAVVLASRRTCTAVSAATLAPMDANLPISSA